MSTITIVLSFKYKRHIASMTPSIKYPHQLSFINQMSSFSENAALGYLKAQVFTKSNPAGDNELTGSGVCRLQQAANISTLSKGRASWLFQLYATGREIFHHHGSIHNVRVTVPIIMIWFLSWPLAMAPGVLELWLPACGTQLPDARPAHAAQPGAQIFITVMGKMVMIILSRASLSTMGDADTFSSRSSCAGRICWWNVHC